MRKYIAILFLIILQLVFNSCKSQKLTESNSLGFFQVEQFSDNSLKLIKKPTSLLVDNDVIKESEYSIVVPKDIKKLSSTVSTIPNEIVFEFSNCQKVFILENTSISKELILVGLNKEVFLSKLIDLKMSSDKLNKEFNNLKKNRYFGIRANKKYLMVYLNVEGKRKIEFDNSLSSFQYK